MEGQRDKDRGKKEKGLHKKTASRNERRWVLQININIIIFINEYIFGIIFLNKG